MRQLFQIQPKLQIAPNEKIHLPVKPEQFSSTANGREWTRMKGQSSAPFLHGPITYQTVLAANDCRARLRLSHSRPFAFIHGFNCMRSVKSLTENPGARMKRAVRDYLAACLELSIKARERLSSTRHVLLLQWLDLEAEAGIP